MSGIDNLVIYSTVAAVARWLRSPADSLHSQRTAKDESGVGPGNPCRALTSQVLKTGLWRTLRPVIDYRQAADIPHAGDGAGMSS